MYQMEKITTGVSYTSSAVGAGYWLPQRGAKSPRPGLSFIHKSSGTLSE